MGGTVFIVLDTLRRDKLSVYNEDVNFTENLDKFSEGATVFEEGVAQAPWTLPSHASMFTGMYPWDHEATEKKLFLDVDQKLLAEKFAESGYETACFSANPWLGEHTGILDGFQHVDNNFPLISGLPGPIKAFWEKMDSNKRIWLYGFLEKFGESVMSFLEQGSSETEEIIRKSKEFIESADEDYFLFINLMDSHLPYFPPEEYRRKHASDVDPDEVCQVGYKHNAGIEEADFESLEELYNAEVDYMDDKLGELLDFVDDDTTIVIVSDHGEHLGEENLIDHQFSVSEKLINVPLMIKSSKLNENKVGDQFELKDLYKLLPALEGLEQMPELSSEYAYGGLEFPEMHLKNIPEDKKEDFSWRLRFVRSEQKKLVKMSSQELEKYTMTDMTNQREIEPDQDFMEKIDDIGEVNEGETDIDDEKVKDKLEELGYI